MRNHRRHLGPRFSEGARQLWAAIEARHFSVAEAAKELDWLRSTLSNVLYGERLPGVTLASDVTRVFGVPIGAWAEKPTEPFIPPAAREVESAEGDEEGAA